MKAPKILAVVIGSVSTLCLAAGIAFALEPVDPTTLPMPSKAQGTSIAKQVASILVYEDQEKAVAMATEFDQIHEKLALDAIASRAAIAKRHHVDRRPASTKAAGADAASSPANDAGDIEAVDVSEPLKAMSSEQGDGSEGMRPSTIDVNGDTMEFVPSFGTASAPTSGAGLWMGSDSTTDNSWGYFIGHNPGSFTCVMTLKNGDPVTICDSDGDARTYHVVDEFIVPDDTYWEDISSRVTEYGESVILQTCCGDNAHYRVVIAN